MNYQEDPFRKNYNDPLFDGDHLNRKLSEQDFHLTNLHASLQEVKTQTTAINTELIEHNELLDRLGNRMEVTEGGFERATGRVKKLYKEMTDRQFTWTASILIFILTILLIFLLFL